MDGRQYRAVFLPADGSGGSSHDSEELARKYAERLKDWARDWGGGSVEIQRRPVGEWETVERWEIPPKAASEMGTFAVARLEPGSLVLADGRQYRLITGLVSRGRDGLERVGVTDTADGLLGDRARAYLLIREPGQPWHLVRD